MHHRPHFPAYIVALPLPTTMTVELDDPRDDETPRVCFRSTKTRVGKAKSRRSRADESNGWEDGPTTKRADQSPRHAKSKDRRWTRCRGIVLDKRLAASIEGKKAGGRDGERCRDMDSTISGNDVNSRQVEAA